MAIIEVMGAIKFRVVVDTERDEDIFRDILINDELTFENLFHAIMSSFDFEGDQLASFYLSNDNWDKGREIGLMDMGFEQAGTQSDEQFPLVMDKTVLNSLAKEQGQKIILVYDFMSMWCFLIELIEFTEDSIESADLLISVGDAPKESERQADIDTNELNFDFFEDEFEDDFNDSDEPEDFENIDDLDI